MTRSPVQKPRPRPTRKVAPLIETAVKAEATAKLAIERKKVTTEIIPPDVSRAKAGAWLTLFSPLTEWAGLSGDRLRHRRAMLRIQNEEVLAEIIEKSLERRRSATTSLATSIPTKFAVPFLEQASLEETGSPLVELWASLLASASEEYSPHHIHFVSILSRLSAEQGLLFQSMIEKAEYLHYIQLSMDDYLWYRDAQALASSIDMELSKLDFEEVDLGRDETEVADIIHEALEKVFAFWTIVFVYGSFDFGNDTYDFIPSYQDYRDDQEIDYSILEALGILTKVEAGDFKVRGVTFSAIYYRLTPLGLAFAKSCRIIPESPPSDVSQVIARRGALTRDG